MNTIYNFLTQKYVPAIPNYMVAMAVVIVSSAIIAIVKKNGLLAYFHNFDK